MTVNMKRLTLAFALLLLCLASVACISVRRQTTTSGPWGTRINGKPATVVADCAYCMGRKNCQVRALDGFYRKCR